MPDFTIRATNLPIAQWGHPRARSGHRLLRCYAYTIGGATPRIEAVVGGSVAPVDGSLGGRLFGVEWETTPGPTVGFTIPAGRTSRVDFTPNAVGHWVLRFWRAEGGAVRIPIAVLPGV